MKRRGLDGFVVPRADEHQGEYVPRRSQRLAWLTGFSGSAGLAIVLADTAAIFIDGRYTLAVRAQVDTDAFVPHQIPEESPEAWIAANLPKGGKLGFDPWLQTVDGHERFARAAARAGGSFVPVEQNPIDAVWHDRPAPPLAPVLPHPVEFAGETSEQRRRRIADIVAAKGADVALLTAPDSIAWLLNVRGGDVPRTPFALGFALLHTDGHVDLYMDRRKIPDRTVAWLGNAVTLAPPDELGAAIDMLGKVGKRVLIETSTAPFWAATRLQAAGVTVVRDADPVALPKACKNAVELEGIRAAHRRDGAAVSRFLGWLGARLEERHLARDRGLRPPAGAAPGDRQAARPVVRHHLRRRPERRDRALPRLEGDRAHARAGLALSRRIRAASIATARPTSPAPWRSARRPPR